MNNSNAIGNKDDLKILSVYKCKDAFHCKAMFNRKEKETGHHYPTKQQFMFHIFHQIVEESCHIFPAKYINAPWKQFSNKKRQSIVSFLKFKSKLAEIYLNLEDQIPTSNL